MDLRRLLFKRNAGREGNQRNWEKAEILIFAF